MKDRVLRAVLVARANVPRLTERLAAALDGTGPAILPLAADLPERRLDEILNTFKPTVVELVDGTCTVRHGSVTVAAETAVVIGTSGSTGVPKGVELSSAALVHSARASLDRIGARPGERWLLCLPASHIAGLQVLVRSLLSGTDPVVAERADRETLASALRPSGGLAGGPVSHVSLVPTQLSRLGAGDTVLNAFKSVLLGGAAAAPELIRAARTAGAPIVTTYGMTETCGGCVYDGEPLPGVRVRLDADDRIEITGPVLFTGYYGQRHRDYEWFKTSDLGRLDPDGRLTVRGRADDVIITGGHKVFPDEVAAALRTAPGVREAAVLGQTAPEWGEQVVAVVVPSDPDDPPSLKMLRMHVKESLPRYASPSRVVLVAAIPLLPSGKPDLMRLRRDLK